MSQLFDSFAAYYDLLYRDKDYRGEAMHVAQAVRRIRPGAKRMLEFGCGSGRHAVHFVSLGFDVLGVDQNEQMLKEAERRRESLGAAGVSLRFLHGDIRTIRIEERFDAVVALFHVMTYLAAESDLRAALTSARAHLEPGGALFFDAWHGPGVLATPPVIRVRRMRSESVEVTRIAEPTLLAAEELVDVNYQIFVRNIASGTIIELREMHHMRYLFVPAVATLLGECGFVLRAAEEWLTGASPSEGSWFVSFAAEAV
jgi:SAM-dependent methyltransferase